MRSIHIAEKAFAHRLVDTTRHLVDSKLPFSEKVRRLREAAVSQVRRLGSAKRSLAELPEDHPRTDVLKRLVQARKRAFGYLRATTKHLKTQRKGKLGFGYAATPYAAPSWEDAPTPEVPPEEPPIEFMEFSS